MELRFIEKVLEHFFHGGMQKKEAVDSLFEYVYFHLGEFGIRYTDEDTQSDFLTWLYPQLADIIEKYDPERSVFFTYFKMSLKYYLRLFERKRYQKTTYYAVAEEEQHQQDEIQEAEKNTHAEFEIYAASPEPAYSISPEKKAVMENTITWKGKKEELYKRRIILLACKSCFLIDDTFIAHIAQALDMSEETLAATVNEAKEMAAARKNTYNQLLEKRDFHYIRYRSAVAQLERVDPIHQTLFNRLLTQKKYNYRLWKKYLQKAQEYSYMPSNRSLAKQFGLGRGTVDASLAILKKSML